MAEKVKPFGTVALVIGAMLVTTSAVAEPVYATEETLVADRAAFKQIAATAASNILSDEVRKIAALLQGDLGNAIRFRPTPSQIDAIAATLQDAEALRTYVDQVYSQIASLGPGAEPGQTEIVVIGPSLSDLPGGYARHQTHFRDGIEIFGFRYVEPGQTRGMAYDGLVRVQDQWIFIPKAWRAFEGQ